MEHQYDIVETSSMTIGADYANQDIVSLFGFGTSGYNHGANCYQPWATSDNYADYYAYGNETSSLYDGDGTANWGYNAISNGGNMENSGWRALTSDEWAYLSGGRPDGTEKRSYGKVNGIKGLILLPDDWTLPSGLSFTAGLTNVYSLEQWAQMEANGAVFLPAACCRHGTTILDSGDDMGYFCNYWSSRKTDQSTSSMFVFYVMELGDYDLCALQSGVMQNSSYGYSVRLVRNAE